MTRTVPQYKKKKMIHNKKVKNQILKNYELYLFLLPTIIYFVIFRYLPMYGIQIAFKDFIAIKGFWGSTWVGMKHFNRFFHSHQFVTIIKNTLGLSLYQLLASFPIPIIFALLLNQLTNKKYKKIVQTVSYAPHFISTVVIVGMLHLFLSPRMGLVNELVKSTGNDPIFFMGKSQYFKSLYVWSGIWQSTGWNAIIYLAALSGISPSLHEAAIVDGANKWQRIWNIDIPGILPTVVILLILNTGKIMSLGFEKAFLMQNPLNIDSSEIISTYVYKVGLLDAQFSFSTAVGLFNSVINLILLLLVNKVAKSLSDTSLF